MNDNFITKLETNKYLIGSFDAYIETTKQLIKNNSNITDEEVETILKGMPTTYRAAIISKDGKYLGYIGLYNVDAKNNVASIRFEVNNDLNENDKVEILNEFNKYLQDSLNITEIQEIVYTTKSQTEIEKKEIVPSSNIKIANQLLIPGVSEKDLERFSQDYSIPRLQFPFTIKNNDRVIGIIGLSNLIWSNKRANLNIFLDKSLGSDISNELSGYIIDDYINYVHNSNVHNITLSVNGSNKEMLDLLNRTNMNYYGFIPFGAISGNNIESNMMFQHIPNMKKNNGILIPDNSSISTSMLDSEKKELSEKIELNDGFKLVRPSSFEKENIDSNKVLEGHIKAMQNRDGFVIPLGEDKYFLQKGNGNYGISKSLMNYSYVVLDNNDNYAGYINILRSNANGKNVEVEIGIDPTLQHNGLGTTVINKFYDELFSIGVASVTSAVFEFNNPSIKLHEKVAELNGIRLESYYVNGKLWDMNLYSKVSSVIEENNRKHL